MKPDLTILGRAEAVDLPDFELVSIPAKIDTGADNSSMWASQIKEQTDGLHCVFFGPKSPHYTGEEVVIKKDYKLTRIANSFGQKELRYKVKLRIRVKGRLVRATFTLSDRSLKTYPILLGRKLLKDKFLVDVSRGTPLKTTERLKHQRLNNDLNGINEGKEAP
jgi:hypothetical protein